VFPGAVMKNGKCAVAAGFGKVVKSASLGGKCKS
jgi:hypothetical protein